jgi:hypothetical protein
MQHKFRSAKKVRQIPVQKESIHRPFDRVTLLGPHVSFFRCIYQQIFNSFVFSGVSLCRY